MNATAPTPPGGCADKAHYNFLLAAAGGGVRPRRAQLVSQWHCLAPSTFFEITVVTVIFAPPCDKVIVAPFMFLFVFLCAFLGGAFCHGTFLRLFPTRGFELGMT